MTCRRVCWSVDLFSFCIYLIVIPVIDYYSYWMKRIFSIFVIRNEINILFIMWWISLIPANIRRLSSGVINANATNEVHWVSGGCKKIMFWKIFSEKINKRIIEIDNNFWIAVEVFPANFPWKIKKMKGITFYPKMLHGLTSPRPNKKVALFLLQLSNIHYSNYTKKVTVIFIKWKWKTKSIVETTSSFSQEMAAKTHSINCRNHFFEKFKFSLDLCSQEIYS